jgi:hypothetical protein
VSVLALVLWTFAVVLFIFGVVFVGLGRNSERAYWSQRDPSGDAARDATALGAIVKRAGHYAAGEYRAPLRITAIGVLLCYAAIGFAILAALATWLG